MREMAEAESCNCAAALIEESVAAVYFMDDV